METVGRYVQLYAHVSLEDSSLERHILEGRMPYKIILGTDHKMFLLQQTCESGNRSCPMRLSVDLV
jgi:hypothetical protein